MSVLLLEDRIERQINFLKEISQSTIFNVFDGIIKNIAGGSDFEKIKEKFSLDDFSILKDYKCVIIHRSAFDNSVKSSIYKFCKEAKIPLVYFSGGISSPTLDESNGFEFLTLNF